MTTLADEFEELGAYRGVQRLLREGRFGEVWFFRARRDYEVQKLFLNRIWQYARHGTHQVNLKCPDFLEAW